MYRDAIDATTFADGQDRLGDLRARASTTPTRSASAPTSSAATITSWADLLSPDFKGKTAIQNIPTIGIMDAIMALRSRRPIKYGDKGNPTKDEI